MLDHVSAEKETIEIEQNIYVVSSFAALPTAYTILN